MNKSEIIAQAKYAAEELELYDRKASYDFIARQQEALIAAARLLEMVEVIEEGSEPMVGDLISHKLFGHGKYYSTFSQDFLECKGWELIAIEKRNGKPAITIKKGEV